MPTIRKNKMNLLRSLALACTVAAATFQAHAIAVDWGPHGSAESGFNAPAQGMINDSFEFSVGAGTTLAAVAVANNLPPVFDLRNGFVQLFRTESGPDQMLAMFGFDGTTGNVVHTFASLVAGDYYYLVTGLAQGTNGAAFLLTSTTVANVPEPTQLSMFLVGLAAAGLVLRKRRPA